MFGKNSFDYLVVKHMNDVQLCQYWSLKFD